LQEGCQIAAYDPAAMGRAREILNSNVDFVNSAYEAAAGADALLILTEREEFGGLDLKRLYKELKYPIVIDGRNLYDPEIMAQRGFTYYSVGRQASAPETHKAGSLGTFHALDVALKYHAKYLLSSTSECYGDPLEHPQKETYWGHVNPIGPRSVYDEAKRFSEAVTMAYHRYHKVDTRIARIFNTYGPRMQLNDGRVIPNFMKQALRSDDLTVYGDGSQTRSFCYVSDEIE